MVLKPIGFHDDADVHGVVLQVAVASLAQLVQLHEERAPRGDVHLRCWALEGRAVGLGAKGIHNVFLEILVDQHEVDLLLEGPGQDGVVVATHEGEEEGQVCPFAHAVPIRVETHAHLVADRSREERARVNVGHAASDGILTNLGTGMYFLLFQMGRVPLIPHN